MSAASTLVRLPDGTEAPASTLTCEGCGESIDNHSCGSTGEAPAPTIIYKRGTGPRKDPRSRPPCPHCNGPLHFSMPAGLQNTECLMRQYYVHLGTIPDAYTKLPVWTLDDLAGAANWAIGAGVSYGRMESAAGGAGTYASKREKTGRRKAQKGERIEDVAAAAETTEAPVTEVNSAETVTSEPVTTETPEAEAPWNAQIPVEVESEAAPEDAPEPAVSDREARRARRRELLAARSH